MLCQATPDDPEATCDENGHGLLGRDSGRPTCALGEGVEGQLGFHRSLTTKPRLPCFAPSAGTIPPAAADEDVPLGLGLTSRRRQTPAWLRYKSRGWACCRIFFTIRAIAADAFFQTRSVCVDPPPLIRGPPKA